ncbi:MAG: glycine oxidase ThiO [Micromonosporaceae bacterium]|nr:glycine oxidase ThiO [Micromonosporaceae bacterium]
MTVDVAVVGGGVIGLAIAWRCARRGLRVRVYDPSPGQGASRASAGMLAPVSEAYFGEAELTRLLVASADRWPAFRAELEAAAGVEVGYRDEGTLVVALTPDDLAEAERLRAYQAGLGLPIEALRPGQLREREPLLSPRLRGGAYAAADRQVDPRRLVAALRAALDGTVEPRAVTDLSEVDAEVVVVAAGCGSAALTGLPVRPVKGQILRLRAPAGAPPGFRHVIRGYADGRSVYLVPRADGEVVVGATAEERRDSSVTAGGVLDLLRAAVDLVPELAEYELAEAAVGHRPGTPDNAPIVGWLEPDRTVVATGHFRHGVVLTPITADAVADLVCTGEVPSVLAPFGPSRFASSLVDAGRSGGTR